MIGCIRDMNGPKLDIENEIERSYTKIITRISENSFEDSLIFEAEKIYPDRDSVLAVVHPSEIKFIPETGYWFYSTFDCVRLPYAITKDAIKYYEDLIDSLNAGNIYQFIITAEFGYNAIITFEDSFTFNESDPFTEEPLPIVIFEKVYVVEMSLRWSHYCGPECGLWINHRRIIVFDKNGNLLNVFLDGLSPVAVS